MPDPVDVYSDQFQINTGAYGCILNFFATSREPAAIGGVQPQPERVATIRMSLEHLKVMAFILHRQLTMYERTAGVHVRRQARKVGCQRPPFRRLGDLSSERLARRSESALCIADEQLVRADHPTIR